MTSPSSIEMRSAADWSGIASGFFMFSSWRVPSWSAVPVIERDDLNEIAARVVQHGDGRAGYPGRRRGELRTQRFHAIVFALDVVHVEHGGWLALLEHGLLIGLSGGIVVSVPSGSSGEVTVSHRNGPCVKSAFFTKPRTSV